MTTDAKLARERLKYLANWVECCLDNDECKEIGIILRDMALRSLDVPEGMVQVPREPTPEMLDAAAELLGWFYKGAPAMRECFDKIERERWSVMLAAAPTNAAPKGTARDEPDGTAEGLKPNAPLDAAPDQMIPGQHEHTDRCGFDRNRSHSEDRYCCECGWPFAAPDQPSKAMTAHDELVKRLRQKHPAAGSATRFEAADALEQQAARIAELGGELAEARQAQILTVEMPDGSPVAAPCSIDGCQYKELQRELAEARADAARYRWLRQRLLPNEIRNAAIYFNLETGPEIDAAIDAART